MLNSPHPVVTVGAFLTLHYRLTDQDGRDIVTTFGATPATLQIGAGQLSPALESQLLGLPEGVQRTFQLTAGEAFGPHNPDLVQTVSMTTLREHSVEDASYAVGDVVDFSAPGGGRFAGTLLALSDEEAVFDFNHPLAGRAVTFEVNIIGIL